MSQIGETANSGAAVAMSAIQRKQKQQNKANSSQAAVQPIQIPTGLDNKKYRKLFSVKFRFSGTNNTPIIPSCTRRLPVSV